MEDIQSRADIELLINEFYQKILKDKVVGFIFTEVVKLDWEVHIPIMVDFWGSILLSEMKYKGNPMVKHIELSRKEGLTKKHFDQWLQLWEATIRSLFAGPKSEEAIERAKTIGALMLHKINQDNLQ